MDGRDWSAGEDGVSMLERVGFLQQRVNGVSRQLSTVAYSCIRGRRVGNGEGRSTYRGGTDGAERVPEHLSIARSDVEVVAIRFHTTTLDLLLLGLLLPFVVLSFRTIATCSRDRGAGRRGGRSRPSRCRQEVEQRAARSDRSGCCTRRCLVRRCGSDKGGGREGG